jgi:hypothetical protein
MNLTEINQQSELLNADENQKKAIFALIDYKTTQDMKEVIIEIKKLENKISTLEKLVWGTLIVFVLAILLKK